MPSRNDFLEQAARIRFLAPQLFSVLNVLGRKRNILDEYTVSTLPSASSENEGEIVYVSDGTSNKRLAISDGSNWRFPDGNVVS